MSKGTYDFTLPVLLPATYFSLGLVPLPDFSSSWKVSYTSSIPNTAPAPLSQVCPLVSQSLQIETSLPTTEEDSPIPLVVYPSLKDKDTAKDDCLLRMEAGLLHLQTFSFVVLF